VEPDARHSPTLRAAVGAIAGGPVGVVTALATGGPLVAFAAVSVTIGAVIGALTAEGADLHEAAVDAILPIGAWLVGAAVAWVLLGTLQERLPAIVHAYPLAATALAAIVGGTAAVTLLLMRLAKRDA